MGVVQKVGWKVFSSGGSQSLVRTAVGVSGRDRARISKYLRDHQVRKLQIGSGDNFRAGWLNTNYFPARPWLPEVLLDATKRFPLPDASFDYVFSEHMIEHVPYAGGMSMLRECFRILKPGGRLRIATPDMDFLVGLLGPELDPVQQAYVEWAATDLARRGDPPTALAVVNNFMRAWGHTFIYNRVTLTDALASAGFVEITPYAINESEDPALCNLEFPERMPENFLQLESMNYEAVKPR